MQINIMHLDQMDVIMCEENSGKNFEKLSFSGQTWW